jgi:hypothetical protein
MRREAVYAFDKRFLRNTHVADGLHSLLPFLLLRPCRETAARYFGGMSTVSEIERAVQRLSRSDLSAFRDWFFGFDAEAWDKQFTEDVTAGRLDGLADEAIRDLREGRCTDL